MEQSPWESDSRSASQEMYHRMWDPKVYYRVHKSSPLDTILNEINPVHRLCTVLSPV
jgi:hypothetical protein